MIIYEPGRPGPTRPDPIRTGPSVKILMTAYFFETIEDRNMTFYQFNSSLQFVIIEFEIDTFGSLETMHFSVA